MLTVSAKVYEDHKKEDTGGLAITGQKRKGVEKIKHLLV